MKLFFKLTLNFSLSKYEPEGSKIRLAENGDKNKAIQSFDFDDAFD